MGIYNLLDNAMVEFVCKAKQMNCMVEMARTQYADNEDVQNVLGVFGVLMDDLLSSVRENYESLLMATRRSA